MVVHICLLCIHFLVDTFVFVFVLLCMHFVVDTFVVVYVLWWIRSVRKSSDIFCVTLLFPSSELAYHKKKLFSLVFFCEGYNWTFMKLDN